MLPKEGLDNILDFIVFIVLDTILNDRNFLFLTLPLILNPNPKDPSSAYAIWILII